MYSYHEIVKTVFIDPIVSADGTHSDNFKIAVYKNSDSTYFARILGLASFDLIVTQEPIVASKNIYYLDHLLPITEEKKFSNIDECLNFALSRLEYIHTGEKSVKEANLD